MLTTYLSNTHTLFSPLKSSKVRMMIYVLQTTKLKTRKAPKLTQDHAAPIQNPNSHGYPESTGLHP